MSKASHLPMPISLELSYEQLTHVPDEPSATYKIQTGSQDQEYF